MHREVFINVTEYTNDQIILVECIIVLLVLTKAVGVVFSTNN